MSARDNFNDLKTQMKTLELKARDIEDERGELGLKCNEAFRDMLIEDQMLSQKTWSLSISMSGCGYLTCDAGSREWKELSEFAETNYHCRFSLSDDEDLRFDDGEISIFLKDMKHLQSLIQKYGMTVHLCDAAVKNIKAMEVSIAEIKKWQEILNA